MKDKNQPLQQNQKNCISKHKTTQLQHIYFAQQNPSSHHHDKWTVILAVSGL